MGAQGISSAVSVEGPSKREFTKFVDQYTRDNGCSAFSKTGEKLLDVPTVAKVLEEYCNKVR